MPRWNWGTQLGLAFGGIGKALSDYADYQAELRRYQEQMTRPQRELLAKKLLAEEIGRELEQAVASMPETPGALGVPPGGSKEATARLLGTMAKMAYLGALDKPAAMVMREKGVQLPWGYVPQLPLVQEFQEGRAYQQLGGPEIPGLSQQSPVVPVPKLPEPKPYRPMTREEWVEDQKLLQRLRQTAPAPYRPTTREQWLEDQKFLQSLKQATPAAPARKQQYEGNEVVYYEYQPGEGWVETGRAPRAVPSPERVPGERDLELAMKVFNQENPISIAGVRANPTLTFEKWYTEVWPYSPANPKNMGKQEGTKKKRWVYNPATGELE